MAKPARSTETIVQAIQQSLAEAAEDGREFSLAQWCEADADGAYVLHQDGRMVGIGEYQYGFSHINELLSEDMNEVVQRYARGEAGMIVSSIEAVDIDSKDDELGLLERLGYAFQADAAVVEEAIEAGKITAREMFELLTVVPGKMVMHGVGTDHDNIQVSNDILVSRLRQDDNGCLAWHTEVEIKAGETVKGFCWRQTTVQVQGGYLVLEPGDFVAPEPKVRRPCGP